ncbi:conserved hypothetical protein, partial CDS, partial [Candidatus Phytoplasma solani]
TIKLSDNQTLQQEWLNTQPRFIRYDIDVLDISSVPEILKCFNINAQLSTLTPGYNSPKSSLTNYYIFKNPPKGLLCAYFKARDNPFNERYPHGDYQNTLDDLL